MTIFRVETVVDPISKNVFAEIYMDGLLTPILKTKPIYQNHEIAKKEILEIFRAAKFN